MTESMILDDDDPRFVRVAGTVQALQEYLGFERLDDDRIGLALRANDRCVLLVIGDVATSAGCAISLCRAGDEVEVIGLPGEPYSVAGMPILVSIAARRVQLLRRATKAWELMDGGIA